MSRTPLTPAGIFVVLGALSVGNLLPQATTVPSLSRATLKSCPLEISTTFVRPAGTSVSPLASLPQATTVPSDLTARACEPAAEIFTTFLRPAGIVSCPSLLYPQPTTVPFEISARPKKLPAEIAVTLFNVAGISVSPASSEPQPITVPFDLRARLNSSPAAMATTPVSPAGTSVCPALLSPQALTVPLWPDRIVGRGTPDGPATVVGAAEGTIEHRHDDDAPAVEEAEAPEEAGEVGVAPAPPQAAATARTVPIARKRPSRNTACCREAILNILLGRRPAHRSAPSPPA